MSSMMTTIGKQAGEMATAAQVLRAEMAGIRQLMESEKAMEEHSGFFGMAQKIGMVFGVVIQGGTLLGFLWLFMKIAAMQHLMAIKP